MVWVPSSREDTDSLCLMGLSTMGSALGKVRGGRWMLEAPCAEPLWATFCSTASLQESGAPMLQPTAPSMTESRIHSWEDWDARRTTDPGRAPVPGTDPLTHPGCSHTPMGALSHSQPCSSTQGSLSLVVTVTVQPGLVSCTQRNKSSKLNEILQLRAPGLNIVGKMNFHPLDLWLFLLEVASFQAELQSWVLFLTQNNKARRQKCLQTLVVCQPSQQKRVGETGVQPQSS